MAGTQPTGAYRDRYLPLANNWRTTIADNVSTQRRVTDFSYDGDGNLTTMIAHADASGTASSQDRTTSSTYYTKGGLKTSDGPRPVSDVTTYGDTTDATYGGYDRTGAPRSITDANGKSKLFDYTPYGFIAKVTDRDAHIVKVRYDERDNPIEVTDPEGRQVQTTYDANDNTTIETSPRFDLCLILALSLIFIGGAACAGGNDPDPRNRRLEALEAEPARKLPCS